VPEPFTYIPKDMPAKAIADGSITSPFLALFGRSSRATGMISERNNETTPAQWLHLLNSSHIQDKIARGPNIKRLTAGKWKPQRMVEEVYLGVLSRRPTAEEIGAISAHLSKSGSQRDALVDTVWALINSPEFLYRH
jgi:hypothetical protein